MAKPVVEHFTGERRTKGECGVGQALAGFSDPAVSGRELMQFADCAIDPPRSMDYRRPSFPLERLRAPLWRADEIKAPPQDPSASNADVLGPPAIGWPAKSRRVRSPEPRTG